MILKTFRKDHLFKNTFWNLNLNLTWLYIIIPRHFETSKMLFEVKIQNHVQLKMLKNILLKIFKYDKITYCSSIINNRR